MTIQKGRGLFFGVFGTALSSTWLLARECIADQLPGGNGIPSSYNETMNGSHMSDYSIAVVTYVLLVGVLVAGMVVGGLLALNLGLMSKRERDHTGGRNPSDVGILKGSNWPQESEEPSVLPAVDEEDEPTPERTGSGDSRAA